MKDPLLICQVALALMWSILTVTIVAQRTTDPCRLFPNKTKLRDPDDCSQEIICIDFKSTPGIQCKSPTPFYNKDTFQCVKHLTDNSTCEIDCTNKSHSFVKDPKSCYGYYYCQDDDLALYGHCPQNYHFDQTEQMCVYDFNSSCSVQNLNFCAIVKAGVKFKDESNCGKYFVCEEIKKKVILKNVLCEGTKPFYYPINGTCISEKIEGCHPVPENVCGSGKTIKKNKFVSDGVTCAGTFFCADYGSKPDPNPQWYKCPNNLFFSEVEQKCVDPLKVECYKDRCEGSKRTFVVSSESGCRHYLRCENGVQKGKGKCDNTFFDEEQGICTTEIINYPACYHK